MTSAEPTFNVVNGEGENTRLHYAMSSGGKKIKEADVILSGRLSTEDIEALRTALSSGEGFRPEDACIPNIEELMPMSWTSKGDERHDIAKISFTNARPSAGCVDASHFASTFEPFDYRAAMAM